MVSHGWERVVRTGQSVSSGLAGLALGLSLSACVAPFEQSYEPAALPAPLATEPALDAYAWLDRADALLDAIADAPPDYTFDHQARTLFAWEVDDVLIVEEPGAEGYVLYLFDPGQNWPFFVRTPDFAAGFDRQDLRVVYARDGDIFTGSALWRNAHGAPGFYQRGFDIRRAAQRSRWDRDAARAWSDVQIDVIETRSAWDDRWRADRNWENYRRRSEAEASRAALQDERRRRREARDAFRRWRNEGAAGMPPPGVRRPERGERADRPRDREERPRRVPATETPQAPQAPVLVREDEPYDRAAPDRLARPRLPRSEPAPPSGSGPALIPVSELRRDEDERRRTEAAELERATRQNEAAAQALRDAQGAEAEQRAQARREAEETARQARAAEEAEQAGRAAAQSEAQRRATEAAAEEAARRQAEQEEADARARAEQRRRTMEPVLEPQ